MSNKERKVAGSKLQLQFGNNDKPSISVRKFIVVLVACFLACASMSSSVYAPRILVASASSSTLSMVGANGVAFHSQSFLNSISSDGLKWGRADISSSATYGNAKNANLVGMNWAGIKILGILSDYTLVGTAYVGKDIRNLTTTQWYQVVHKVTLLYPYIHAWEFLNEPNSPFSQNGHAWTPEQYLTYLVPTYQALHASNPSNVLIGPTETIWTFGQVYDDSTFWEVCGPNIVCDGIGWFKVLWGLSDPTTGLTPAKMLNYVSIHMYTQGYLLNATLSSGPYAGRTVGAMLSAGLNAYYSITGDSKKFMVDEFGYPSSWNGVSHQTSTSILRQRVFYQQVMSLFESKPYIIGVFAYQLKDSSGATDLWGLFNSQSQPKLAWSIYQKYFP